jgi:hypothetical protein
MSEELNEQQAHRHFAAVAFNECWKLIKKSGRTADEDDEMLRLAEASFWHWKGFKGHTDENLSIGYWQLARVYVLASQPERALRYANRCAEISEKASLGPFYIGYAYEASARALKAKGDDAAWRDVLAQAYTAAETVTDEESRDQLLADLKTIGEPG